MTTALTTERFSDIIGTIYDCILTPALWTKALGDIRCELGFDIGLLGATLLQPQTVLINAISGVDHEEAARVWNEYKNDLEALWGGLQRIQHFPLCEPIVQSQVTPKEVTLQNRFFREWAIPRGQMDAVRMGIVSDRNLVGTVTFGQFRPIDKGQIDGLRLLAPHIRRAITISDLFDMKTVEAQTFAATVEALAVAVLLVDEGLGLVHANGAGERMLAEGSPVSVRNGKVRLPVSVAHDALEAAVSQAARNEAVVSQRSLAIPARHSDGGPVMVHVLPLRRGAVRSDLSQRAVAALFVVLAGTPPQMPRDALILLYDLTQVEAKVLELICEGVTVAGICTLLGIAESTVKTHLKRVFGKTGCKRQVELVRLVASLSLTI